MQRSSSLSEAGARADGAPTKDTHEVVSGPARGWAAFDLAELWRYRELFYFLAWRDIKVRYKQTLIGGAWAVLKPIVTMSVFSIVFGTLLKVPSPDVPYPVFSYSALLPWLFFSTALAQSSSSLVANTHLIAKAYFPRLIMPIASALTAGVDFAVAFVVLLGLMLIYGIVPGFAILSVPLFLLVAFLCALGIGLMFAATQVKYRDVGHIVPILIQFWLFATPVAYPRSLVPAPWQPLYDLNPMVGVIEGFRWATLAIGPFPAAPLLSAVVVTTILVAGGLLLFGRAEREFADVI